MDSMMAVEIKQSLEREFDIFLTAQEIRNLTFANLKKISSGNDNTENKETPNIEDKEIPDMENEKLFNIEIPDFIKLLIGVVESEYFILEPCVNLSTKEKETTTEVFLVPGIDGCGAAFNHLASSISFSSMTLYYSVNDIDAINVISDTVNRLTEVSNCISS